MANRNQDDSPWTDPRVKLALESGRPPTDIALLSCPKCGIFGYYNQGSHFCCRFCKEGFYVRSEDEQDAGTQPAILADEAIMLSDFDDCSPDGY